MVECFLAKEDVAGSTPVPTPQAENLQTLESVRVGPRVADDCSVGRARRRVRFGEQVGRTILSVHNGGAPAARAEAMQCVDTAFAHAAFDDRGNVSPRRGQTARVGRRAEMIERRCERD